MFNKEHKKIIDKTVELGGVIYGGYIRDALANREPTDIDICFFDAGKHNQFKTYLREIGLAPPIKFNPGDKEFDEIVHDKVVVPEHCPLSYFYNTCKEHGKYQNDIVKVDLFLVERSVFNWGHSPDVNINRLMYTSKGIETYQTDRTSLNILQDIKNNVFTPEDRCPKERIDKLLAKGWELHPDIIVKQILE